MSEIKISHLTKDYGNGKGIFDLDFTVKKGEVFGYLGPNRTRYILKTISTT